MKEIYTLQEMCEITGLSKWTIKRYQKLGLIPDRRNQANNFRVFTIEDKEALIKLLTSKKNEKTN